MNLPPRQPEDRSATVRCLEALPDGTAPELIALDRRLDELARRGSTPPDLPGRVFRASVRHLPQAVPARLSFRRSTAVTAEGRTPWWWGQVALAASLALAFVLAGRLMLLSPPGATPGMPEPGDQAPSLFARHTMPTPHRSINAADLLSDDEVRVLMPGGDVDYLLVTRDLTMSDLTGDLARLYDELGM